MRRPQRDFKDTFSAVTVIKEMFFAPAGVALTSAPHPINPMTQLKYEWQCLWTIKFWDGDKYVCELTYVGGKIFTPHSLAHILKYNAHYVIIFKR